MSYLMVFVVGAAAPALAAQLMPFISPEWMDFPLLTFIVAIGFYMIGFPIGFFITRARKGKRVRFISHSISRSRS